MRKKVTGSSYEDVCRELGFSPEVRFVEIVEGRIGFSVGKPYEIVALYRAARAKGYRVTPGLRDRYREVTR